MLVSINQTTIGKDAPTNTTSTVRVLLPALVVLLGVVAGTFFIAAIKVRYVMLDFMELRSAPTASRVFFEGWIVVVLAIILGFWFLSTER